MRSEMADKEYIVTIASSLDRVLNDLSEDSGLNKGEIIHQALVIYQHAYETFKSGGKVLLQDGKTYENREVKGLGR